MKLSIKYQLTTVIFCKYFNYNQGITISGGQDSLCLTKLIETNAKKNKKITNNSYIYIDHQWRKDSYKQIIHLINYLKVIDRNIYIYQLPNTMISEELCRIYRYNLFIQHAINYNKQLIITGHSETDKLETFLNNFFRGSGIQGITSLTLKSKINCKRYILRPLINLKRNDIYWLCKKFHLPIWSDTTNYIYNFERNRIRYELIPYLKKYFHENIENNINTILRNCYQDNEYIKQNVVKLYMAIKHKKYIALNHKKLRKQNFSLQFKIIQLFYLHNFNLQPKYKEIITVLISINKSYSNTSFYINFNSLNLIRSKNWLYIVI